MDFTGNLKRYSKVRTVSIAFPSSIFDNTPTPELEAYLVGQVARAAVVFNVCEIIIFQEGEGAQEDYRTTRLHKLFDYAECPQYLRKRLFNIEPDLRYAGIIHPLEAQHHLRKGQLECPYREGITIAHVQVDKKGKNEDFTEVNIGLNQPVLISGHQQLNTRITVQVDPSDLKKIQAMLLLPAVKTEAIMVAPVEPVQKLNLFWGYYVRTATCLTQALRDNIFDPEHRNFYDLIIGTSERGECIDQVEFKKSNLVKKDGEKTSSKKQKCDYNHILIVFGGVKGLEHSALCDTTLKDSSNVSSLFDYYLNTCPNQGSTTIRTEEALWITLSALRPKLNL